MKLKQLEFQPDFEVIASNQQSQAAVMVIAPGQSEGGPGNRHRGADQWLYVVSGEGAAVVTGKSHRLRRVRCY